MLSVPRQYLSVALMLSYKLDFSCCANMDGFPRPSYIFSNSDFVRTNSDFVNVLPFSPFHGHVDLGEPQYQGI